MKLVFMGTPDFARIVLERLEKDYEILAVCTQPDKPVGRKQILTPPPVKLAAQSLGLPIIQPEVLDAYVSEYIAGLSPDVIVVVAYGKILPESILSIAPCINLHASILPKYRGASPIQQMILSDDSEYGISVMAMDSGLDSGDILSIARIPRDDSDCAMLSQNLAELGAQSLCDVLADFSHITPIPQDHSQATYCKKIHKNDGLVCFDNAQMIYKKWLAFSEWPGVFLSSGIKLFGIAYMECVESMLDSMKLDSNKASYNAGEICSIDPCIIACDEGFVRIEELQTPSRNRMRASVFLQAHKLCVGDILR